MNSKTAILLFIAVSAALMTGVWFYSFTMIEDAFKQQQQTKADILGILFTELCFKFSFTPQYDGVIGWTRGAEWFPPEYRKVEDKKFPGGFRLSTEYTENVFLERAAYRVLNIATRDPLIKGVFIIDKKGFIPWAAGSFTNIGIMPGGFNYEIALAIQQENLTDSDAVKYIDSQLYNESRPWGYLVLECNTYALKQMKKKIFNLAGFIILTSAAILSISWPGIKRKIKAA